SRRSCSTHCPGCRTMAGSPSAGITCCRNSGRPLLRGSYFVADFRRPREGDEWEEHDCPESSGHCEQRWFRMDVLVEGDRCEPVGEEQPAVGTPGSKWRAGGIVGREVVAGNLGGFAGQAVAAKFVAERFGVVFQVVEH